MSSEQDDFITPQPFHCPNCGASLPDSDIPSVRCSYCGSKILIPPEQLPRRQPEPIVIMTGEPRLVADQNSQRAVRRTTLFVLLMIVTVGLAIALITIAAITITTREVIDTTNEIFTQATTMEIKPVESLATLEPVETLAPTSVPFTSVLLQFGEQGSGPGQFEDPRQIAVDIHKNIYVADYDTGRLQKFTPDGAFLQVWQVPPTENGINFISDLAADSQGRAYAARGSDILVYADGVQQPVNVFPGHFPDTDYNALAIDAADYIYSLVRAISGEDLIKLDQSGQELLRKPDIVYEVNKNTPAEDDAIAVDGQGNTYFLSTFETQVYKYDAEGNFSDRFGSQGKQPGQFFNPNKLAVDGQNRIYVLDNDYIHIFDQNGAFLNAFEWDYKLGSPRDIAADAEGNVYIVTSQAKVLKFLLNW